MSYALYHLTRADGSTVELSHGNDIHPDHLHRCDSWLEQHRAREEYRRRRGELAELKETRGCGYRPGLRAVQS